MKKMFFALIFCVNITAFSLFAFEAEDLTKYPSAVPANSFAVNIGIGLNYPKDGNLIVPPLSASVDYNLPIGGLPFFLGGIVGFYSSGEDNSLLGAKYEYTYSNLDLGFRIGYHFNWDVDGLDTYAVGTFGYQAEWLEWKSGGLSGDDSDGSLLFGAAVGARWFFTPVIGVFMELGYSALSFASTGLSIHF
ncbi:outer membrane beta-barrel protein [Treponema primitia]|uniref:outer membrane beta-barrel protein n=1 Tax=Treponema primitia TaxID=88058 RepID=UPI0002555776|nr:outer membrane beta-barrel protein [Treponema primitia]